MTWIPLLLADPSPCFRSLVLRDLLGRDQRDDELRQLLAMRPDDPLAAGLLASQAEDGSWSPSILQGSLPGGDLQATAQALNRLGYLGFDRGHAAVRRAADFIFSHQAEDGSWPMGSIRAESGTGGERRHYERMALQTALPLRGLAACGYADDPRAEAAYEWLLAQRLEDGAWPTGVVEDNNGYVAGYRRIAHSRWGCRSNTTGALLCLALHPERRHGEAARRALDLLLGRETREAHNLGFEVARTLGAEPAGGWITYYARFDMGLMLDLCRRVGAGPGDARIAGLIDYVRGLQGSYGLWEYARRPQAARWVSFDLLRSLVSLDRQTEWVTFEPHTPFQAYPRDPRRF